ncbi:MAG: TIGR02996 domain-containing protein, partial [Gemmataceae bacterium]
MTPDELLFALAPDGRAVKAAREAMRAFTDLRRSADGTHLSGQCQGSYLTPYPVLVHKADAVRCACDCGSMKYPCKHALALVALDAEHPGRFTTFVPTAAQVERVAAGRPMELPAPEAAPNTAGEALLQAIFADPSDDAARLIYADWLSDHGTPAEQDHADFIRVSTRILREGPSPRLFLEYARLWDTYRSVWLAHVPSVLQKKVETVGGFVRSVNAVWSQLARFGEQLAARYPIDILDVGGKLDLKTAGKVAVMTLWQRVRTLTLRDADDAPRPALELIFQSHYLSA